MQVANGHSAGAAAAAAHDHSHPNHDHGHHHQHTDSNAGNGVQAGAGQLGTRSGTFECPVCRKPQILDPDNLKVDEGLQRFVEKQLQTLSVEKNIGEPAG